MGDHFQSKFLTNLLNERVNAVATWSNWSKGIEVDSVCHSTSGDTPEITTPIQVLMARTIPANANVIVTIKVNRLGKTRIAIAARTTPIIKPLKIPGNLNILHVIANSNADAIAPNDPNNNGTHPNIIKGILNQTI